MFCKQTMSAIATIFIVLLMATAAPAEERNVSTRDQLNQAMADLQDNDTVVIQPATYNLNHGFWITQSGVTIRGATGNRDDVILNGGGMNNASDSSRYQAIQFKGGNNTIQDLTIEECYWHAVHVQPGAHNSRIRNITTRNIGTQHIKVGAKNTKTRDGIIENSRLEQTRTRTNDGVNRPDDYLNGIDLLGCQEWKVRDNVVRDIQGVNHGGPAILLWKNVTDSIVERNVVVGNAAGIHLGNTSDPAGAEDCIVRNNFIAATSNDDDALMTLAFTKDVKAYNNTLFGGVPNGDLWFTMLQVYDKEGQGLTENLDLQNNLIRGDVWDRSTGDWSAADVEEMGNMVDANGDLIKPEWFIDPESGDLHLTEEGFEALGVEGIVLPEALYDFDGQLRGNPGDPTVLGADIMIPEPTTSILFGSQVGLFLLVFFWRRRRAATGTS